mgnify:CR=1 FL=1
MSPRYRDKALVEKYRKSNPRCELRNILNVRGFGYWLDHDWRPIDIHHIASGVGRRVDSTSNIISLCRPCHEWVQHRHDGLVLCLYIKKRKGELSWRELSSIRGRDLCGVVEIAPVEDWVEKYREVLLQDATFGPYYR